MEYLNLETHVFRSTEFIAADPIQRGTWIALQGWCASQENSGRIAGCRAWKDRMWQQLVGVTSEEVLQDCTLWGWEGDDLVVLHYPVEQEQALRERRDRDSKGGKSTSEAKASAARSNGAKGGRPAKPTPEENPTGTEPETQRETQAETEPEPKVKEGNGKESKGREEPREFPVAKPKTLSPSHLMPVDRVKAELAAVFPAAPRNMTAAEMHELFGSLATLDELSAEDWHACRAWMICPERVRGRPLWPRSRSEFVANAGQAVEAIRQWWPRGGRAWWNRSQAKPEPKPPTVLPAPVPGEEEEITDTATLLRILRGEEKVA